MAFSLMCLTRWNSRFGKAAGELLLDDARLSQLLGRAFGLIGASKLDASWLDDRALPVRHKKMQGEREDLRRNVFLCLPAENRHAK